MTRKNYLRKMKTQIVELAEKNPDYDVQYQETKNPKDQVIFIFGKNGDNFLYLKKFGHLCFSFQFGDYSYEYSVDTMYRFVKDNMEALRRGWPYRSEITNRQFYKDLRKFINNLNTTGIQ